MRVDVAFDFNFFHDRQTLCMPYLQFATCRISNLEFSELGKNFKYLIIKINCKIILRHIKKLFVELLMDSIIK